MENAAEALKIAFAVSVFIMALTVAFMLITQARSTADVIFMHTDKQEYVDNITAMNRDTSAQIREVGIDTIIPTIYRYAQENYGVIIIDSNDIKAIYDLQIENTVSKYSPTWDAMHPGSQEEMNKICGWDSTVGTVVGIKQYVENSVGSSVNTSSWNEDFFKKLFGKTSGGLGIYRISSPNSVSCPWTTSTYNIMQRIKVDMYGGEYHFGGSGVLRYDGVFGDGTGSNDGFIHKYAGNIFKEYYYAIKETNPLSGDEEVDRIQIIYVKE